MKYLNAHKIGKVIEYLYSGQEVKLTLDVGELTIKIIEGSYKPSIKMIKNESEVVWMPININICILAEGIIESISDDDFALMCANSALRQAYTNDQVKYI